MKVAIKSSCIGCGMCQAIAGEHFKVVGIPAVVIKQPSTPEEQKLCQDAINSCPAQAIYDEEAVKMAA